MPWIAHLWFAIIAACIAYGVVHHHRHERGDHFNRNGLIAVLLVLAFVWSMLVQYDLTDIGFEPEQTTAEMAAEANKLDADRYEATGIACAEEADNDSGNICRARIGDQECITVLPDDDTKTDLGAGELMRCVPLKGGDHA